MKRKRYEEVHRAALRWPASAFAYIGIDNEGPNTDADYEGERKFGLEPFLKDAYGCHGQLAQKRKNRNHFRRFHPYFSSAPEMAGLMDWCPRDNSLYPGRLPWT